MEWVPQARQSLSVSDAPTSVPLRPSDCCFDFLIAAPGYGKGHLHLLRRWEVAFNPPYSVVT